MQASEHIVLESDEHEIPALGGARRIHAELQLKSRLRRHLLKLSLLDYYFLGVDSDRPRSGPSRYVLDLRLTDSSLQLTRHIAWRWLLATLALVLIFAAGVWHIGTSPAPWWRHGWLPVCATLLGLSACAGLIGAYRTTETVALYSAHGRARLVQFTGGLGTFRRIQAFVDKLRAHVQLAQTGNLPKAEQLRRAMREHFRLRESGVLSELEYEASKRRILSQHG